MSYRCQPQHDVVLTPHKDAGHGPRGPHDDGETAAVLINATFKGTYAPVALPRREFMENAKALWERLGLPDLKPEMPWFGYSLGDWTEEWDNNAADATRGEWMNRSESYRQRRRRGITPNTPSRAVEGKDDE